MATLFLTHPLTPRPSTTYITINAPYAFLTPTGNGFFELFYYDSQGNLHDLGTFNVTSSTLAQAVNVINSFNQQNMGTTVNGQQFIPLSYEVVIGNSTGTVQIPVQGNTILLDKVNPGYWTIVVSDPNDLNKLAYALDVGYKEAATVSGTSNLWNTQPTGTILQEIANIYHYTQNPAFGGISIIIMNNGTLIPWGYMFSTTQHSYGYYLSFILQAHTTTYS